jgi:hypothetical protein
MLLLIKNSVAFSPQANYSDRRLLAKLLLISPEIGIFLAFSWVTVIYKFCCLLWVLCFSMLYQRVNNGNVFCALLHLWSGRLRSQQRTVMPLIKKAYELYILVAKSVNRTNRELLMSVVQCVLWTSWPALYQIYQIHKFPSAFRLVALTGSCLYFRDESYGTLRMVQRYWYIWM